MPPYWRSATPARIFYRINTTSDMPTLEEFETAVRRILSPALAQIGFTERPAAEPQNLWLTKAFRRPGAALQMSNDWKMGFLFVNLIPGANDKIGIPIDYKARTLGIEHAYFTEACKHYDAIGAVGLEDMLAAYARLLVENETALLPPLPANASKNRLDWGHTDAVIGESADRCAEFSSYIKGSLFDPSRADLTERELFAEAFGFVRKQIEAKAAIFDVGNEPDRKVRSALYGLQSKALEILAYAHVTPVRVRPTDQKEFRVAPPELTDRPWDPLDIDAFDLGITDVLGPLLQRFGYTTSRQSGRRGLAWYSRLYMSRGSHPHGPMVRILHEPFERYTEVIVPDDNWFKGTPLERIAANLKRPHEHYFRVSRGFADSRKSDFRIDLDSYRALIEDQLTDVLSGETPLTAER